MGMNCSLVAPVGGRREAAGPKKYMAGCQHQTRSAAIAAPGQLDSQNRASPEMVPTRPLLRFFIAGGFAPLVNRTFELGGGCFLLFFFFFCATEKNQA